MTDPYASYLPIMGNHLQGDSPLLAYSQARACPCHLYVQQATETMSRMISLTSTTLLQTQNLLGQAELIDWQGRAAENFRETLVYEMGMVHDQEEEISRTAALLQELARP